MLVCVWLQFEELLPETTYMCNIRNDECNYALYSKYRSLNLLKVNQGRICKILAHTINTESTNIAKSIIVNVIIVCTE